MQTMYKSFLSNGLNSKGKSPGMPTEIIGGPNKTDELYFIITGIKESGY